MPSRRSRADVIIDDRDFQGLMKALRELAPEKYVKKVLRRFGDEIIEEARIYPPPMTDYQRTGNLGRSWEKTIRQGGLEIRNYADYAGYVVGPQQRDFHKEHGWKQLVDVIVDKMDGFIDELKKEVGKIWSR